MTCQKRCSCPQHKPAEGLEFLSATAGFRWPVAQQDISHHPSWLGQPSFFRGQVIQLSEKNRWKVNVLSRTLCVWSCLSIDSTLKHATKGKYRQFIPWQFWSTYYYTNSFYNLEVQIKIGIDRDFMKNAYKLCQLGSLSTVCETEHEKVKSLHLVWMRVLCACTIDWAMHPGVAEVRKNKYHLYYICKKMWRSANNVNKMQLQSCSTTWSEKESNPCGITVAIAKLASHVNATPYIASEHHQWPPRSSFLYHLVASNVNLLFKLFGLWWHSRLTKNL